MNAAKTSVVLIAALTLTIAAQAQSPSGIPPAATGGQLMGHHHASTVPESILRGEADVIRAFGEADYNHSAAWLIREGAYSGHLDNRLKYTQTYFQMRAINAEARAVERGMPPCRESVERYNRERTPCRLASHQMDLLDATIHWPFALQCKCFDAFRKRADRLFAERTPENSGVGSRNYRDVQAVVCTMRHLLKHRIHELDSAEYRHARKFIDSLGYESRHRVMPENLTAAGHAPEGGGAAEREGGVIAEDVAAAVGQAVAAGAAVVPAVDNVVAQPAAAAEGFAVAEGAPVVGR